MFTDEQKKLLSADLDKKKVKERDQSGRKLSYIEGWHAIAEANRIFGFDGWTRETVDLKCVSERERTIGAGKQPGWGVTYIAKVRITVEGVTRDGCGTGHGIDRDLGQAHESALKEAETDAMKRALMTFGNPFGLALYDKQQTHVSDCKTTETASPSVQPESNASLDSHALATDLIAELRLIKTVHGLKNWGKTIPERIVTLTDPDAERVRADYRQQLKKLNETELLHA